MLENRVDFVLFDALCHHVHEIRHDGSTKLQVEVRFDSLFGDGLCHTLAVTTLELTREEIPEPSFQERNNAAHEE